MIEKLLIANRGEIAARIARTCRELGIASAAVYTDVDADGVHPCACDEAVRISDYLDVDAVLAAAAQAGADAVHPGYGFLAENAGFARAVIDAGLIWVGPSPESMERLGAKIPARALAEECGVPVLRGTSDLEQAGTIGFPLLVKASAGGGGKGMRVVRDPADLAEALAAAGREAEAAFGDGALFVERFVERPRHVEVQILGDTRGRVIHLYERECSIQRRHQKIVEESPSCALSDARREALLAAAVRLGEAVGYVGAGTVEFLVDGEDFYFLEVNTRLQVEHPVTEMITGLDLVEWQLKIAEGQPIPDGLRPPRDGAAIEVRVYAEDAEAGWLPQTGPVLDWWLPADAPARVEAGVASGGAVTVHYDPMLAKLIAHGPDRASAIRRLVWSLRRLSVLGLTTNRDHLIRILQDPAYQAGEIHTRFLVERELPPVDVPGPGALAGGDLARIAALACELSRPRATDALPGVPRGWRSSRFRDAELSIDSAPVRWRAEGAGWRVGLGERSLALQIVEAAPPAFALRVDGHLRRVRVVDAGARWFVSTEAGIYRLDRDPAFPDLDDQTPAGGCVAPMTATVRAVRVAIGDTVEAGAPLVILEAMKMEQTLSAAEAGVVTEVNVEAGRVVDEGTVMVVVASAESE